MNRKTKTVLALLGFMPLLSSSIGMASTIKKKYINLGQEAEKALVSDIPANYAQIGNLSSDMAYSDTGIHGKIFGFTRSEGKLGNGIKLDGSTGYVWLGTGDPFRLQNYTIESWFKTDSPNRQMIYRWRLYGVGLFITNGIIESGMYTNPSAPIYTKIQSTKAYHDGDWHHVALTYNGTNYMMYVNGEVVANQAVSGTVYYNVGGAAFGRDADSSNSYFQGDMDEFRIWNRARTQEEIKAWMNKNVQGFESGLVSHWSLD